MVLAIIFSVRPVSTDQQPIQTVLPGVSREPVGRTQSKSLVLGLQTPQSANKLPHLLDALLTRRMSALILRRDLLGDFVKDATNDGKVPVAELAKERISRIGRRKQDPFLFRLVGCGCQGCRRRRHGSRWRVDQRGIHFNVT